MICESSPIASRTSLAFLFRVGSCSQSGDLNLVRRRPLSAAGGGESNRASRRTRATSSATERRYFVACVNQMAGGGNGCGANIGRERDTNRWFWLGSVRGEHLSVMVCCGRRLPFVRRR